MKIPEPSSVLKRICGENCPLQSFILKLTAMILDAEEEVRRLPDSTRADRRLKALRDARDLAMSMKPASGRPWASEEEFHETLRDSPGLRVALASENKKIRPASIAALANVKNWTREWDARLLENRKEQ